MKARTVVVAAASRHGSTAEIAYRIGQVLREHLGDRWRVRVEDLAEPLDLDGVDAVVLGSAVYLGHWLHPASQALHQAKDAPLLDLWLFSTGPVSAVPGEGTTGSTADQMVESGCAAEHVVFPGRVDVAQLSRWERLVVRAVGVSSTDRRDWAQVDGWAARVAAQLDAVTTGTGHPHDVG